MLKEATRRLSSRQEKGTNMCEGLAGLAEVYRITTPSPSTNHPSRYSQLSPNIPLQLSYIVIP